MKDLFRSVVFGRNPVISGSIAMAVVMSIALGCNCSKDFNLANSSNSSSGSNSGTSNSSTSSDSVPAKSTVEGLVRDTTSNFRDAVNSGDFSELYNDASADFQGTYTLDQVTAAFKSYTDKKKVVVPILDKVDAAKFEWTGDPSIRSEKGLSILMASGKFDTKPYNVRTDYEYVLRGGEWKLLKLVINIP
jgi:hypothetical protein